MARIVTNANQLGEAYSESIPALARELADRGDIVEMARLLGTLGPTGHIAASAVYYLASVGLWLNTGGRMMFIDPPEK